MMFQDDETKAQLRVGIKALTERKNLALPEKQRLQVLL